MGFDFDLLFLSLAYCLMTLCFYLCSGYCEQLCQISEGCFAFKKEMKEDCIEFQNGLNETSTQAHVIHMHLEILNLLQAGPCVVLFLKPSREFQGKCFCTLTYITTERKHLAAAQADLLAKFEPFEEEVEEEAQPAVFAEGEERNAGSNGGVFETQHSHVLLKITTGWEITQVYTSTSLLYFS